MGRFGIGQAVARTEDPRLLTGRGRYADDVGVAGQAYGVVMRSPHAHATINHIDTGAARRAPGVLAVYASTDLDAAGIKGIPCQYPPSNCTSVRPEFPILVRDKARYVGDAIAFVVAESLAQAEEAAELVAVDYDPLPAVCDAEEALAEGAPQIWSEALCNRCFTWERGDRAATDAAFARASRVIERRVVHNRIIVSPMEPRCALGQHVEGRYVLETCSQGVHILRDQLADDIFRIPRDRVKVLTGDVGGGFGMKAVLFREQVLVLHAARELGRPVKWTGERSGDIFVSDTQGRDQIDRIELALDGQNRFIGLRVRGVSNMGAYLSNAGPGNSTDFQASVYSGVYAIPAVHAEVTGAFTNTVPIDAYRGAGRPECAYRMERMVDFAARELGVDAMALRRANFIPPSAMPYKTAFGSTYDCGEFARNLDLALERSGYATLPRRKAAARRAGKHRGVGISYYIEGCGGGAGEPAYLSVTESGSVVVDIGTQSNGQGHETAYAQVVADTLGIDIERVRVVQGDSDRIPAGGGTGGSRSVPIGSVSCRRASLALIETGKDLASGELEVSRDDVEYEAGAFKVTGTDLALGIGELAAASRRRSGEISDRGYAADGRFDPPEKTYPNGCHVCEVEIDEETGTIEIARYLVVDDFGTVVNPLMLAGQVHGGIAQGVGQALTENCVYEAGSGQLLSGSFMDYCLPRAGDLPFVELILNEDVPCTTNPLGIKGAGEAGTIGALAAVANAVVDALADRGVKHVDMPITSEKVWRLLHPPRV